MNYYAYVLLDDEKKEAWNLQWVGCFLNNNFNTFQHLVFLLVQIKYTFLWNTIISYFITITNHVALIITYHVHGDLHGIAIIAGI